MTLLASWAVLWRMVKLVLYNPDAAIQVTYLRKKTSGPGGLRAISGSKTGFYTLLFMVRLMLICNYMHPFCRSSESWRYNTQSKEWCREELYEAV